MRTSAELGFERLLAALAEDMLKAPDEEILAVADELGQKPAMKGSIALAGITFLVRPKPRHEQSTQKTAAVPSEADAIGRARRRPKGGTPSGS
ncbi:MAG TPA: hypothetical protein VMF64_17665 [Steroidobacteraceae bacterium]|nr:hypothetical protein [Steroidobacteraceae bacterium]